MNNGHRRNSLCPFLFHMTATDTLLIIWITKRANLNYNLYFWDFKYIFSPPLNLLSV